MIDRRDIERLYRELGHVVLRRARAILRSDSEARDVLQEIFLGLLARPEQLEGVALRTSWLYRATTNRCLNLIRNRQGRERILHSVPRSEEALPRGEALATVRDLLGRLPSPLADVAVYYYVDEMSQDEIAAILGCSRRHVGDLVARLAQWSKDDVVAYAK
jgi:RNA polymerase sigma-70 factor (ECF subfamily)